MISKINISFLKALQGNPFPEEMGRLINDLISHVRKKTDMYIPISLITEVSCKPYGTKNIN